MSDKCPNCGKFVSQEHGFYTREEPDSDLSYMVVCCDQCCADEYEEKYYARNYPSQTNRFTGGARRGLSDQEELIRADNKDRVAAVKRDQPGTLQNLL